MRIGRDAWVLGALTVSACATGAAMYFAGRASALEVVSFATGAVCVWLTVKESVWNFPVSLVNVATFLFVFARARLLADAGLQVVYFVLTAIGWYQWLYGGQGRTKLSVGRVPRREATLVALSGIAGTAGLYLVLPRLGGSAVFWDALTTSLSLCAQWLLNRKYVENWYCWIAVDVVYVPLYLYKGLYLTSLLYAVFLCMATMGLIEWRRTWRRQGEPAAAPRPLEVVVPA
jgi:nicotinamide mononucleotide transporter